MVLCICEMPFQLLSGPMLVRAPSISTIRTVSGPCTTVLGQEGSLRIQTHMRSIQGLVSLPSSSPSLSTVHCLRTDYQGEPYPYPHLPSISCIKESGKSNRTLLTQATVLTMARQRNISQPYTPSKPSSQSSSTNFPSSPTTAHPSSAIPTSTPATSSSHTTTPPSSQASSTGNSQASSHASKSKSPEPSPIQQTQVAPRKPARM